MKKFTLLTIGLMIALRSFSSISFITYDPNTGTVTDDLTSLDLDATNYQICDSLFISVLQEVGATDDVEINFWNNTTSTGETFTISASNLSNFSVGILVNNQFFNWIDNMENGVMTFYHPFATVDAMVFLENVNDIDASSMIDDFDICSGDSLLWNPDSSNVLNVVSWYVYDFIFGNYIYPNGDGNIYITGGAYQVFFISSLGCIESEFLNVDTYPNPVYSITSTNPTTCGGDDGEIQFNGLDPFELYQISFNHGTLGSQGGGLFTDATGMTWQDGLSAGICNTFSITNTEGCTAVDSFTVITLVDPTPIEPIITVSQDTICSSLGETSTLSVTNTGSFTSIVWEPVSASNPFTTSSTGTFYVDVLDANNCPNTSINYVIVEGNCDLSIDELSSNKIEKIEYYNFIGQKVEPIEGIYIRVTTFTDGSLSTEKMYKVL